MKSNFCFPATLLSLTAENFNGTPGAIQTKIRLQPGIQEIGEGESKP